MVASVPHSLCPCVLAATVFYPLIDATTKLSRATSFFTRFFQLPLICISLCSTFKNVSNLREKKIMYMLLETWCIFVYISCLWCRSYDCSPARHKFSRRDRKIFPSGAKVRNGNTDQRWWLKTNSNIFLMIWGLI